MHGEPESRAVRRSALRMINGAVVDGRTFAETSERALAGLAPAAKARAQRLASETLRFAQRADRVLGPFLQRRPSPKVQSILRLGVTEICANAAAPHGVVGDLVQVAKSGRETSGQAGLVNAVLRKVGEVAPKWASLPVPELPKWLRKPLVEDYGSSVVRGIEAAHANGAPMDLTPRDGNGAALAATVGGTVLPTGSVRLANRAQVSELPGYAEGTFWVQDAAAALPARVLEPAPGSTVLDLCAAPGGKTLQLSAMGAEVTAVDISERRLSRVRENLTRTGLDASIVAADALTWVPENTFDAILLDAPCSATGTIRRHPDLPFAKSGDGFPALFELQAQLIDRAVSWLRPGGRLVFCTCSLLIDEGEEQVRDALERVPELRVDPDALRTEGIDPDWIGEEGGARIRPDHWADLGGIDGFYIVAFRTEGAAAT
ncbi:MAG: transcription antitermination factor NusB [Pseudomonadota bacterium]